MAGDETPGRAASAFDDWLAIQNLLFTYAELVDSGRFEDASALFAHATYRVAPRDGDEGGILMHRGTAEVLDYMERTRRYADGTPRTKHVNSNVLVELDGDTAISRCYVTVFQQTDTLPLQPIAAGRYVDRFERAQHGWRFTDRLVTDFLAGVTGQHKGPKPA